MSNSLIFGYAVPNEWPFEKMLLLPKVAINKSLAVGAVKMKCNYAAAKMTS